MIKYIKNRIAKKNEALIRDLIAEKDRKQIAWSIDTARAFRLLESQVVKLQNNQPLILKQIESLLVRLESLEARPTLEASVVTFATTTEDKPEKTKKKSDKKTKRV